MSNAYHVAGNCARGWGSGGRSLRRENLGGEINKQILVSGLSGGDEHDAEKAWVEGGGAVLNRVIRVGLFEKVTNEQR